MPQIERYTLLSDYSDQSVQYSPYQFLSNLGKYVVDNQIGAICDLIYPINVDGTLGHKSPNGFLNTVFDFPLPTSLPFTSLSLGVSSLAEVFEAFSEDETVVVDADLVLGLGPFGTFIYSTPKEFYLVDIKGKSYLGCYDSDNPDLFHLFSFVKLNELVEYYTEVMDSVGTDDPEEAHMLIEAEEVDSEYQPRSWFKPTSSSPKVFQANTSIFSGYNPVLVRSGLCASQGFTPQGYVAPPEHISDRFNQAVSAFADSIRF